MYPEGVFLDDVEVSRRNLRLVKNVFKQISCYYPTKDLSNYET